jgi:hypothetical protein
MQKLYWRDEIRAGRFVPVNYPIKEMINTQGTAKTPGAKKNRRKLDDRYLNYYSPIDRRYYPKIEN